MKEMAASAGTMAVVLEVLIAGCNLSIWVHSFALLFVFGSVSGGVQARFKT